MGRSYWQARAQRLNDKINDEYLAKGLEPPVDLLRRADEASLRAAGERRQKNLASQVPPLGEFADDWDD